MVQTRLDARARSLLAQAGAIGCGAEPTADVEAALRTTSETLVCRLEGRTTRTERVNLLAVLQQVHALQCEICARAPTQRLQAITNAQDGVERLRDTDGRSELLHRAAEEACRSCGVTRCIVARVVRGDWKVVAARFTDDADAETGFLEQVQSMPPGVNGFRLESSLLRRRVPVLVDASAHVGGVLGILEPLALRQPYVVCPVVVEQRVIALIYGGGETGATEVDRDALAWFAAGVAHLYERAALLGRLYAQRDQVQRMASSTHSVLTELTDADIELQVDSDDVRSAAGRGTPAMRELPGTLTRRELEVLSLMAAGVDNAGIAERLVLAEGTVKSHVKHVFRKLGSSNRAEAVARYLHHHMEDVA